MTIQKFEDLISWQKGKELTFLVYKLFKNNRDFGFRGQIQRAALSIPSNIAEGFERRSNKESSSFCLSQKDHAEKRDQCWVLLSN